MLHLVFTFATANTALSFSVGGLLFVSVFVWGNVYLPNRTHPHYKLKKQKQMAGDIFLTTREAAAFTGLSLGYLYKLTHNKMIPHYKPNGKLIYFDRKELEAWLKRNKVMSVDEAEMSANRYLIEKGGMQ